MAADNDLSITAIEEVVDSMDAKRVLAWERMELDHDSRFAKSVRQDEMSDWDSRRSGGGDGLLNAGIGNVGGGVEDDGVMY